MGPNEFYTIQPCFTGGEISPDVASRVDLDKYQLALLQAENAVIRPYGAVKKRPGMMYCGAAKYAAKKSMLVRFNFSAELNYLLEFGEYYVRVWRAGTYLGVEVATPYSAADLSALRFVQSVDVMYITSGKYPVKKLMRYSETSWSMVDISWSTPAFGNLNPDENIKITPSGTSGPITLTSNGTIFGSAAAGDWIEIQQKISGVSRTLVVTGSGSSGTTGVTSAINVGDTWKIITHGTWAGTLIVQSSTDGGNTWIEERRYTSSSDYNPTESGTVDEYTLMKMVVNVTSGTITADLSAYAYTHTGHVKITSVSSSTVATAVVVDSLGDTSSTDNWKWGAWSGTFGYPVCATFFQDRLCFGGSSKYPQRVWMSKTGDYENFSVEKESGKVTDDSAVSADLLSLQSYKITHMVAGNDLIILTEGNEWTISGAETVTPSSITPRSQQSYGANDVIPIRVGNRVAYVQRRGSIVRDMGYSYDTDSYGGQDLTLLAKHLIRGHELMGSTFAQEPDSVMYFVRDDGALLELTYIMEQKVFAWAHIVTDGMIESVCAVSEGNNDILYAAVKRTINGSDVRYIERFDIDRTSASQQDYVMMDSAVRKTYTTATKEISGLQHLEGKKVKVMGDGYLFEDKNVSSGKIVLEQAAKNIVVGLPYKMVIEQPNFETQLQDSGTMQGRNKEIASVILRLENSFGGEIGPYKETMNEILYDIGQMETGEDVLFSGDIKTTMAAGGFNKDGRVYISHDSPYPFCLAAIIRAVTFGGTGL